MFNVGVGIFVRQPEDVLLLIPGYDLMFVLRVEVLYLIHGHSGEFVDLSEVKHLVHLEGVDVLWHLYDRWTDAVFLVICHCIQGTYKSRNIASRLSWKVRPDIPESSFASASSYGFVDISGSAVVGSDCKVPVTENLV